MLDLRECAEALLAPGKGILAADESNGSADKRLIEYGIPPGEESRQKYRELFLDVDGIENYLTGVILYEETISEKVASGMTFPELLRSKGIVAGIKVDQGLEPFPDSPDESITNGLIGLPERLIHFRNAFGLSFTKWRAVITIDGTRLPTTQAIHENAKRLATYALAAQQAAMVPIVEPEMLRTGNHSRMRAKEVLRDTLSLLVSALEDQAVDMGAVILKTAMVISGSESGKLDTPEEVAHDTVDVLIETVPATIAGIVFLSGGQSTEAATQNLAAIEKYAREKNAPWPITFSYARALQDEALTAWAGKDENLPAAREVFINRLKKEQQAIRP
jgi:fructose-bisphosphate aldolase class I